MFFYKVNDFAFCFCHRENSCSGLNKTDFLHNLAHCAAADFKGNFIGFSVTAFKICLVCNKLFVAFTNRTKFFNNCLAYSCLEVAVALAVKLTLDFVKGEIAGINGKAYDNKVAAIQDLEALAAPYAIGRDMHIGDTIIGIKGRVGFEAAAPMLIIAAHKMLEKHTLTKWQQYWKDQVGTWYGMFLHEAQYLEPVMRDIEAFLDSSQQNVTGRVIIELHPYRYVLVGVESDYDLMKSDFGEYGEVNKAWSADDVKGFTKILGNQMKIFYSVQNKNKK